LLLLPCFVLFFAPEGGCISECMSLTSRPARIPHLLTKHEPGHTKHGFIEDKVDERRKSLREFGTIRLMI